MRERRNGSRNPGPENPFGASADTLMAGTLFAGKMVEDDSASYEALSVYLKDIAKLPLLTGKQEVELAIKMEKGRNSSNELALMASEWRLPNPKEAELEERIREANEARRILTESNLRLVVSVARKYMGRGLGLQDLIQEGNIGLTRGVEKFDYRKGFKFSTYAYWWIRQGITRAIADQGRIVRIPSHMVERINKVYGAARTLRQELGQEPTLGEIAAEMKNSEEFVRNLLVLGRSEVSLDFSRGDADDPYTLADELRSDAPGPDELAAREFAAEGVRRILDELKPNESKVLKLRYGIGDGWPRTSREVGDKMGLTRARVGQIEAKAIRELMRPDRLKRLQEYL